MKLTVLKNSVPINEVLVETPDLTERYEIYVGRAEDCHVQINDPLMSRHHFVIKNTNASWSVEKKSQLGSLSINGKTGTLLPVNDQDEIKCGVYSVLVSGIDSKTPPADAAQVEEAPAQDSESDDLILNEGLEPLSDDPAMDLGADHELAPEEESLDNELADDSLNLEDDLAAPAGASEYNEAEVLGGDLSSGDENNIGNEYEQADLGSDNPGGFDEGLPQEDLNFGAEESLEVSDDFGGGEVAEEATRVDRNFINYELILFGEHAPYDRYQLVEQETFIGRDTRKCQIVLNDPEVSTVHAVLRKSGSEVILEDLNSSNGTILNGERINRAQITTGDEFVIGSTSFTLEVRSELLDAEADRLMPVEQGQIIETEEIEEEEVSLEDGVNFESAEPPEKSIIKRILKNPEQRKKAIYGLVAVTLMIVLFYEEEPEQPQLNPQNKAASESKVPDPKAKAKVQLSKELENKRNISYELGVSFFEQNKYYEALKEFQTVAQIDPDYKNIQTYLEQTKTGLKRLEELETQKRAEEERIKLKKVIDELLAKARDAVKERQVTVAENYFSQITEKDPENIDVQQLKLELEAWQKEEQRKKLEQAAKDAARKAMVDALAPGKTFYLKREWYRSILKLEDFLRRKGMDEDLVKEASDMLSDAKNQLASELGPVLGKARSFKEGQDLKSAYQSFLEVLKLEPTNSEALNEVDDIKHVLESRSKRIYREAIIAESLSLFADAKEKFQEVQQISPTDSEYYRKASEKLRNYLE